MQAWEERLQVLEEGRSEGLEKGIQLTKKCCKFCVTVRIGLRI